MWTPRFPTSIFYQKMQISEVSTNNMNNMVTLEHKGNLQSNVSSSSQFPVEGVEGKSKVLNIQ